MNQFIRKNAADYNYLMMVKGVVGKAQFYICILNQSEVLRGDQLTQNGHWSAVGKKRNVAKFVRLTFIFNKEIQLVSVQ